jgi:Fic family protein
METLDYDFGQEKKFNYKGLSKREKVERLAKFTSGIWQIHPFGEGNTRATAVFIIKYLYTLGFVTNNDLFEQNSKYFRNALVRANYQNLNQDIYYTMEYLNKFFGNLLLGEKNLLDNREMQIKDSMMSGKESSQKSSQKSSHKILELMKQNPAITTTELAQLLNISRRAIAKQTALLKEKGLIRRIGPDKGGHWEVLNDQK